MIQYSKLRWLQSPKHSNIRLMLLNKENSLIFSDRSKNNKVRNPLIKEMTKKISKRYQV